MIGRVLPPGPLGRLEGRPPEYRRALPAELARRPFVVGTVDGYVHTRIAHRLLRTRKPPGVAELRKQRHAGKLPDAVVGHHERLTAGLGASVGSQLLCYGRKLLVYVLNHRQRKVHPLPGRTRKLHILQVGATLDRIQIALARIAIVEELGVDALLVGRALLDELWRNLIKVLISWM